MRPTRLRAVYLDLDDTLCDSEGLTPMRLEAIRAILGPEVDALLLDSVLTEAAAWDPLGLPGRPPNRLQRLKEQLGLTDEQHQRMRAVYNQALLANLRLHDGVPQVLAWLRRHVALGLITNGPSDFQRGKIERLGLAPYFDSVTISGDIGKHKPDPEIFHVALAALDVRPDEAVYVGDRPEADIAGARAAGIPSVLVQKDYAFVISPVAKPDHVISAIVDLPRLLVAEGWLPGSAGDSSAIDAAEGWDDEVSRR